jgi:hypothetical protein
MKSGVVTAALGVLVLAAATDARAGEAFIGVYRHDIDDEISHGHYEKSPQIIFGAKTAQLDELKFMWSPRVHLLASVSTRNGTSYVASGFTWNFRLSERFYVEPGIGVAIHNGHVNLPRPDEPGLTPEEIEKRNHDLLTTLDLGSRVLFEPNFAVGWKATDRLSVEASWIHLSHAKLAGYQNPGLGDLGLRIVYRYGVDR